MSSDGVSDHGVGVNRSRGTPFVGRLPPTWGVGNKGEGVQGVNIPCIISTVSKTKCVFGSADEAASVRYETSSPIVRSGSCRVAIMGVVVIPESGKRKCTWVGYRAAVSGEGIGDAASDGASGGVVDSGVVDTLYM